MRQCAREERPARRITALPRPPTSRPCLPPSLFITHALSQCRPPYYWNRKTGETTAVGEPKPGPGGRLATYRRATRQPVAAGSGGGGGGASGLLQLVAMGAGISIVFALISRVL